MFPVIVVSRLCFFISDATHQNFILQLAFSESLVTDYGAAAAIWVAVEVPHAGHSISIEMTLINKTVTKIPGIGYESDNN